MVTKCAKCGFDYGEQPYCTSIQCLSKEVLRVEKNPKGGFLTYFEGSKYPGPFYPKQDDLNYVDTLKRVIISSATFVTSFPVTPKRFIRGIKGWMGEIYQADQAQHPNRFPEENLSETTQEILRALIASEESEYIGWCYYLSAIWDTDQAYGLRGKDVFQNIDKSLLRKHPRRAIMNLVELAIEREDPKWAEGQKKKLRTFKKLLWVAMLSTQFRRQIADFFMELDILKMRFTIEERYWLANRFDYNYEGKSFDERMAWKCEEDKTFVASVREPEKPKIQIMPPNKAFYDLSESDARRMCAELGEVLFNNWNVSNTHQGK